MTPPSDPLARVERAAEEKRRAELEYRAALQAARDAGHSAGEIARPAGITRQAVLKATVSNWQARAEARLEELDARWNALVDKVADVERPPDSWIKRETAKRNGRRGKDARRGLPARPTVLAEARSFAESKLLRTLLDHPEDPSVRLVVAEIDEANRIREQLEAHFDRVLGID